MYVYSLYIYMYIIWLVVSNHLKHICEVDLDHDPVGLKIVEHLKTRRSNQQDPSSRTLRRVGGCKTTLEIYIDWGARWTNGPTTHAISHKLWARPFNHHPNKPWPKISRKDPLCSFSEGNQSFAMRIYWNRMEPIHALCVRIQ